MPKHGKKMLPAGLQTLDDLKIKFVLHVSECEIKTCHRIISVKFPTKCDSKRLSTGFFAQGSTLLLFYSLLKTPGDVLTYVNWFSIIRSCLFRLPVSHIVISNGERISLNRAKG